MQLSMSGPLLVASNRFIQRACRGESTHPIRPPSGKRERLRRGFSRNEFEASKRLQWQPSNIHAGLAFFQTDLICLFHENGKSLESPGIPWVTAVQHRA
jgi:hypothetical protein